MNLSPIAQEQLALQHRKYLNSLPDKKTRIRKCWKSILSQGWTNQGLACLRTEAHRLSGSAGSYGLISLGKAAQKLERMLTLESDMSGLTDSISDQIEQLLIAFDEAIEADPPNGFLAN